MKKRKKSLSRADEVGVRVALFCAWTRGLVRGEEANEMPQGQGKDHEFRAGGVRTRDDDTMGPRCWLHAAVSASGAVAASCGVGD